MLMDVIGGNECLWLTTGLWNSALIAFDFIIFKKIVTVRICIIGSIPRGWVDRVAVPV